MKLILKTQNYKNKKIIVMSPPSDEKCPRLVIASKSNAYIMDDYNGKLRFKTRILKHLV
jgi:hypothetical protein